MDVRGWSDIAYSFLIDDDDDPQVFEGRGSGVAGGHTKGRNTVSHGICVIGNFQNQAPQPATLALIVELVRFGADRGWWPRGFTGGHRDVGQTSCPGDALYHLLPELNRQIITESDDMWTYLTIDEALVRQAFARGWVQGDINYWLGLLINPTHPDWDNFKRAVTNGLVRAPADTSGQAALEALNRHSANRKAHGHTHGTGGPI